MEYGLFALLLVYVAVPMATGLKCYTCTDTSFETDNEQVNTMLSKVIKGDKACGDDDISGMTLKDCSTGPQGTIAACSKVKVEASASVINSDFTFMMTIRQCTFVGAGTKDMCQDMGDEAAKGIPQMEGITYDSPEAKSCICSTEGCNGQTTLAPAIVTCLVSLVLAIFTLW